MTPNEIMKRIDEAEASYYENKMPLFGSIRKAVSAYVADQEVDSWKLPAENDQSGRDQVR